MKFNSIVNAIARREWFISRGFLEANAFLLHQLMNSNLEVSVGDLPKASLLYNVSHDHFDVQAFDDDMPNNTGNKMVDFSAIKSPGTIVKIPIIGAMFKYEMLCSWGMENVRDVLIEASQCANCSGVILDIDSGGGEVAAVAPVIEGIVAMNAANKPVVAFCDMACSAAQWVAAACNLTVASNDISSTFGSIGVMVSFMDTQPYFEQMGYKYHTIYAPESSEKNLAVELALKGEYDKIKIELLSPLALKFIAAIKSLRSMKVNDDHSVFKGATFRAASAVEIGLIDKVGSLKDCVNFINSYKKSSSSKTSNPRAVIAPMGASPKPIISSNQ